MGKQFIWDDLSVKGALASQTVRLRVLADGSGITAGKFVVIDHANTTSTDIVASDLPGSDYSSIIGFADSAIAANTWGEIAVKGLITLTGFDVNDIIAIGDNVYFSAGTNIGNTVINPNFGNILIGTSTQVSPGGSGLSLSLLLDLSKSVNMPANGTSGIETLADANGIKQSLNISNLADALLNGAVATDDVVAIYDTSTTSQKKMTIAELTTYLENNLSIASDFTDLGDTPANYTAASGKIVKVNAGGTGLEYGETISTAIDLGANAPSDLIISTQKAVKDYVDNMFETQLVRTKAVKAIVVAAVSDPSSFFMMMPQTGYTVLDIDDGHLWTFDGGSGWEDSNYVLQAGDRVIITPPVDMTDFNPDTGVANDIFTYDGQPSGTGNDFTFVATPDEGWVAYVDIISTNGATDGSGKDVKFINDGTGLWEYGGTIVSDHAGLSGLNTNVEVVGSHNVNYYTPNQHQNRRTLTINESTNVNTYSFTQLPLMCSIDYSIDRVNSAGSRIVRTGTVQKAGLNEGSEISSADGIIVSSGGIENTDGVILAVSGGNLSVTDTDSVDTGNTGGYVKVSIAVTDLFS